MCLTGVRIQNAVAESQPMNTFDEQRKRSIKKINLRLPVECPASR